MAETLREQVVALSLEKAISRAICATRSHQIKEAESTFRQRDHSPWQNLSWKLWTVFSSWQS